jgi:hypothetical protein
VNTKNSEKSQLPVHDPRSQRDVAPWHEATLLSRSEIPFLTFGTAYGRTMQRGKPNP